MRRGAALLILLFSSVLIGGGQPAAPPRWSLAHASTDWRDRCALAAHFLGVLADCNGQPPRQQPHAIGDRADFRVIDVGANTSAVVTAALHVIGAHVLIWVEAGLAAPDAILSTLAAEFDGVIYPQTRALWLPAADWPLIDVDGDPRVHVLFTDSTGGSSAGYFSSDHVYPAAVVPTSSERELLIFSAGLLDAAQPERSAALAASIAAHEYQHLLRYQISRTANARLDLWLNEALSQYTEFALYGAAGVTRYFYARPDTPLHDWSNAPAAVAAHYGAALDWILSVDERCGRAGVQTLAETLAAGGTPGVAVDNGLLNGCGTSFMGSFADWLTARADRLASVPLLGSVRATVSRYGTDVYTLPAPADSTLTLAVTLPPTIPLLPIAAAGPVLWSRPGDLTQHRLAFDLDLTGVTTAAFRYRIWHDLEAGYDYGYVTVERPGQPGAAVNVTPTAETFNPHGIAYGAAYTGTLTDWRTEQIDLTPFAGTLVRLGFTVVTDDGLHQRGVAFSDLMLMIDGTREAVGQLGIPAGAGWGWRRSAGVVGHHAQRHPDPRRDERGRGLGAHQYGGGQEHHQRADGVVHHPAQPAPGHPGPGRFDAGPGGPGQAGPGGQRISGWRAGKGRARGRGRGRAGDRQRRRLRHGPERHGQAAPGPGTPGGADPPPGAWTAGSPTREHAVIRPGKRTAATGAPHPLPGSGARKDGPWSRCPEVQAAARARQRSGPSASPGGADIRPARPGRGAQA